MWSASGAPLKRRSAQPSSSALICLPYRVVAGVVRTNVVSPAHVPSQEITRMDRLTLWLHLVSLAAYFGGTLAFVLVMLPIVDRIESHDERLHVLTALLARLNPLLI